MHRLLLKWYLMYTRHFHLVWVCFSLFLKGLLGFRGVLYFFKLNSYKVNLGPSQALQLAYSGIYLYMFIQLQMYCPICSTYVNYRIRKINDD